MIRQPYFLFNEETPTPSGGMASESLATRLAAFIAEPEPPAPATPPAEPPATPPAKLEVPGSSTPPADPPVDPPAQEDEEEEFHALGTPPAAPAAAPAFDESAFDAQTATILAELEKKGHPGEVYKQLRADLKARTREMEELKAAKPAAAVPDEVRVELEELRTKAAEAEALRQRNQELLRVNDEVAVREGPEFQTHVAKPIQEMQEVLVQMAEGAGIEASLLFSVVQEADVAKQDKMLDQLQNALGSRMLGRLERIADDYKVATRKGQELLANASKNAELTRRQRAQQEAQERQQSAEAFKLATSESFTKYAKRIPGFTDSSGNLTDVAKATLEKTTAIDPATLSPSDLGYMAFAANSLPELRKALVKAEKELAVLRGTRPAPVIPPPGSNTPPAAPKEDKPMGLVDAMRGKEFVFNPPG